MTVSASQLFAFAWRCWPLLLGNVLEWYEFGVYGYLSEEIDKNFFRGSKLAVWFAFALAFTARPLGGILLGSISDRYGRRFAMNVSGLGMLLATVCQGLLPSYLWGSNGLGEIGTILLCILRVIQGICAGGEISIIHSYLLEEAPLESLALITSLAAIGGNISFLLANVVVKVLQSMFTEQTMVEFGWRLPFVISLAPGLLAAWGRSRFPESELFLEISQGTQDTQTPKDGKAVPPKLTTYWPSTLLGIAAPAAGAASLYVGTMWCLTYVRSMGVSSGDALLIGITSNLVGLFTTPVFAYFADLQGAAYMLMMCGVVMMMTGLPGIALMLAFPGNFPIAMFVIGICYGSVRGLYANTFVFCAELFPTSIRSRGLGYGLNIGVTLFGGFGGLLAQASLHISPLGPGYLMLIAGAITVLAVLWSIRLLRLGYPVTHRRAEPYFGAIREPNGDIKVKAALIFVHMSDTKPGTEHMGPQRPSLMSSAWMRVNNRVQETAAVLGKPDNAEPVNSIAV